MTVFSEKLKNILSAPLPHRSPLAIVAIGTALICIWLLGHRYAGIVHDARHYTALSFYKLGVPGFENDLLFLNGHRTVTIFPALYGALLQQWSPGISHMVLVIVGQGLWFAGLVMLALRLMGSVNMALLAVGCAMLMNSHYGYNNVLKISESIATPRLFSEAMMLYALAAAVSGKRYLALALSLGGMVFHPLMAGPGALVIMSVFFGTTLGIWLPVAFAAVLFAVLGIANSTMFDIIYRTFDTEWETLLLDLVPHFTFNNWDFLDAGSIITQAVVLIIATTLNNRAFTSLARGTLTIAALFCAIAWIGDVLHSYFIVNLHLWRSLWLIVVLGNLMSLPLLLSSTLQGSVRLMLAFAIGFSVLTTPLTHTPLASVPFALIALITHFWRLDLGGRAASAVRILGGVAMVLFCLVGGSILWVALTDPSQETAPVIRLLRIVFVIIAGTALVLPLTGLNRWRLWTSLACSLSVLAITLPTWDNRSAWKRYTEAGSPPQSGLAERLAGKMVYWEGGAGFLWLVMKQPSFFSCIQSAPIIADRNVATEFARRGYELNALNTIDFRVTETGYCPLRKDLGRNGPANAQAIQTVCENLPALDLMALFTNVPSASGERWPLPVTIETYYPDLTGEIQSRTPEHKKVLIDDIYLYDCAKLRDAKLAH
ncbi:hypothetical protein [Thalassovita aquimarina]|uniref:Uncharacterized protein n=2 Tax=Thalassovita aquimarina TaxID=2785917 RepID=A0ABS5HVQ4_9RHOB|nr:hypothetical protein [Thalassovita aquimarina]MBR9652964.1 hypothetical protein [Thalassovita aquimarina]